MIDYDEEWNAPGSFGSRESESGAQSVRILPVREIVGRERRRVRNGYACPARSEPAAPSDRRLHPEYVAAAGLAIDVGRIALVLLRVIPCQVIAFRKPIVAGEVHAADAFTEFGSEACGA